MRPKNWRAVGTKRLYITALTFGINCVERQRRFARTTQAGYNHQLIARQLNINILEVVLARTSYYNLLTHKTDQL